MKKLLAVLLLVPSLACAQSAVRQSGVVSNNDAVKWTTTGIIQTAGTILGDNTGLGVNPFAATDLGSKGVCSNNATTTGAYNQVCIGHDSSGNGLITLDSFAGAPLTGLNFRINNATYGFPGPGNGNVSGPSPTVATHLATWNSAVGTLLADPASQSIVFTNTQMNEYAQSPLNGINFGTEYSSLQAGNFATDALAGGVAIPNTATVWQANGVAAYANNASTTTNAVALYSQIAAKAANTKNWAANFVCATGAFVAAFCEGIEVDINVNAAAVNVVNGVSILGASTFQPTNGNAISIGSLGSGIRWPTAGVFVADAAANNAFVVGKTAASGANVPSQAILFNYTNGASTQLAFTMAIDATQTMNLTTSAGTGLANLLIDGVFTINAPTAGAATLNFTDTRVTKYQLFRDSSDSLVLRDSTNALTALSITTSGTLSLGETGKIVNMIGTINLGGVAQIAPATGTPVASLCLDAGNNIIKKTTAGSCI